MSDLISGLVVYELCRECLYGDAREGCFEYCDVIVIVQPQACKSEMHPWRVTID